MSLGVPNNQKPPPSGGMTKKQKVHLKPGKGLVDWIRLSNSGRLTPHNLHASVDQIELARHNTEVDCWILLFDTVYDVTQYMEFHPGGVPELMRAAGTDATELFTEIHRWVNYKSMMKSCVIGPFHGKRDQLQRPRDSSATS